LSATKPQQHKEYDENGSGYLCMREINFRFNILHYLGNVNFKHKSI